MIGALHAGLRGPLGAAGRRGLPVQAGLQLWTPAAAVTSGIGAIAAMPNLATGGATSAQANAARRPSLTTVAGEYAVQGGTGLGLDLAGLSVHTNSATAFFVCTPSSPSATARYLTVGPSDRRVFQQYNGQLTLYETDIAAMWMSGVPVPAGAFVAAWRKTADGACTFWANRTRFRKLKAHTIAQSGDTVATSGIAGNYSGYTATGFAGTWRDLLVYAGELTDADVVDTLDYLAGQHGLGALAAPTQTLVFDGDSLTLGYAAFPAYTDEVLVDVAAPWTAHNLGQYNRLLSSMAADAAAAVDPLRGAAHARNVVVVWGGTNDLAAGVSAADAYATLQGYGAARQAAGWQVVVLTMLPRSATGDPADIETQRQSFNGLVRANWATFADALADVGGHATIGAAGAQNNATYYMTDKVHLKTAGYAIVASHVSAALAGV